MIHIPVRQRMQRVAIIGLGLSTDMQICPEDRKCSDSLVFSLFTLISGSDVAESKLPSPWGDRKQRHRTGHDVLISEDWKSTGNQNGPKWKC